MKFGLTKSEIDFGYGIHLTSNAFMKMSIKEYCPYSKAKTR
ncbi:MAG: hypothetical protein QM493_10435 [Sulfurovum sp.]